MLFINNKYTKWYNSLINKAKNRNINSYTEKHHIIPSSLGGTNDMGNLVKLTPREHFVCHLLLTKMTTGNDRYKMIYALHMISNIRAIGDGRYTPSSKLYEISKKLFIEQMGTIWTDEKRKLQSKKISTIMKTSLSLLTAEEKSTRTKNSCSSPESWNDARRKKISRALIGKVLSDDTKNKMSISKQNLSEAQKLKCGDSNRGKTWKLIDGKRVWIVKEN